MFLNRFTAVNLWQAMQCDGVTVQCKPKSSSALWHYVYLYYAAPYLQLREGVLDQHWPVTVLRVRLQPLVHRARRGAVDGQGEDDDS